MQNGLIKYCTLIWAIFFCGAVLLLGCRAGVAALVAVPEMASATVLLAAGLTFVASWRPAATIGAFALSIPLLSALERTGLLATPNAMSVAFVGVFAGTIIHTLIHLQALVKRPPDWIELTGGLLATIVIFSAMTQWLRLEQSLSTRSWAQPSFGFSDRLYFIQISTFWVQGFASLFLLRYSWSKLRISTSVFLLTWSITVLAFFLLQFASGLPAPEAVWAYIGDQHSYAYNSPFEDLHALGSVAVLLLTIAVFDLHWRPSRPLSRLLLAIGLGIVVLFSFSRAAWIGALVACGLASALRFSWHRSLAAVAALIAVIMLANFAIPERIWIRHSHLYRIHTLIRLEAPLSKISSRLFVFRKSIGMILERPLTGHGIGSHYMTSIRFAAKEDPLATKPEFGHNLFLQLAAEIGLPAAVLFAALPTLLVLHARRLTFANRGAKLLAIGTLIYLQTQLTANSLNIYLSQQLIFWATIGCIAAQIKRHAH